VSLRIDLWRGRARIFCAFIAVACITGTGSGARADAATGTSDRDGGIALRLRTPNNYYLVQLDALRDRVLLSLVTDGVPEEIVGVDAEIVSHTWRTLAVRASDVQFIVSLDRTWMFTGCDRTLCEPGRIALWTKSDSVTRFDQIEIAPLP
jgi:hypothetical protein